MWKCLFLVLDKKKCVSSIIQCIGINLFFKDKNAQFIQNTDFPNMAMFTPPDFKTANKKCMSSKKMFRSFVFDLKSPVKVSPSRKHRLFYC